MIILYFSFFEFSFLKELFDPVLSVFWNISSFSGELSIFELALDDDWDGARALDFCILLTGVRVLTDSCGDGVNGNTVVDFEHFFNRGFHFSIRKTRLMVMKTIEFNSIMDM